MVFIDQDSINLELPSGTFTSSWEQVIDYSIRHSHIELETDTNILVFPRASMKRQDYIKLEDAVKTYQRI